MRGLSSLIGHIVVLFMVSFSLFLRRGRNPSSCCNEMGIYYKRMWDTFLWKRFSRSRLKCMPCCNQSIPGNLVTLLTLLPTTWHSWCPPLASESHFFMEIKFLAPICLKLLGFMNTLVVQTSNKDQVRGLCSLLAGKAFFPPYQEDL